MTQRRFACRRFLLIFPRKPGFYSEWIRNKPLEKKRAPMYNEAVYHLKGRWEKIARKENEALMEASYEERLAQTGAPMDFARHLRRRGEEDRDVERVRKTWNKLKAGPG